jgi:hypothetical protein
MCNECDVGDASYTGQLATARKGKTEAKGYGMLINRPSIMHGATMKYNVLQSLAVYYVQEMQEVKVVPKI